MTTALRCAARRLGGSLLQGTQAAVTEEGRRLVPSRFIRSGQVSTKHAGEIPKELEPSEVESEVRRTREELRAKLDKWDKEKLPESTLRVVAILRGSVGVLDGAAKLAILGILTAVVFGGEAVEAQAVTKGNQ